MYHACRSCMLPHRGCLVLKFPTLQCLAQVLLVGGCLVQVCYYMAWILLHLPCISAQKCHSPVQTTSARNCVSKHVKFSFLSSGQIPGLKVLPFLSAATSPNCGDIIYQRHQSICSMICAENDSGHIILHVMHTC
jgi:hypothetical protein